MKTSFLMILLSGLAFSAFSCGNSVYQAWLIHKQMQFLSLADDASTPAKKAEFIQRFLDGIDVHSLPEYSAFIFTHERNRVANQVEVLKSLKQRCDDLAMVAPSSLGYAQGMEQITGQEFDHALSEVESIFSAAQWVRAGWWKCYGWLIAPAVSIVVVIASLLLFSAYNQSIHYYRH